MKLPLWLTTVTPLLKALAVLLFILFPILFFFIGMQYGRVNDSNIHEDQGLVLKLKEALKNKDTELQLAIENRGRIVTTFKKPYHEQEFGIYVPGLIGKQITHTIYDYKQTTITFESGELDTGVHIETWNFKGAHPAIFQNYENYLLYATPLSEVSASQVTERRYSANNRILYWGNDLGPRQISAIFLQGLIPNIRDGNQMLLRISTPVNSTTQVDIETAKNLIIQTADSIPYRKVERCVALPDNGPCSTIYRENFSGWYFDTHKKVCIEIHTSCNATMFDSQSACEKTCLR